MDLRAQLQSTLGDAYELERELGGGGMSRVFVAEERAFGRKVVVKVLSPELAAGVSSERFTREIRLAAQLQQANIVPLLTAGETSGLPYYTMPFVEGQSLKQRLVTAGALSISEAVNILRDVARALAYAHDRGVIHRDIKPENVLLSGHAAVVTDFGIAKAISVSRTETSETLTSVGTAIGTPAYMAPEQAIGDTSTDHRADVYSFGCLGYELLTGASPFHGRSAQQLLVAHVHETAASVDSIRAGTPPQLASLVMRCLSKDPSARPQTAREILEALDGVATPSALPTATAWRFPRARRFPAIAAAVILVAAGAAALAFALARGRAAGVPQLRALAVMPFTNVSADTAEQYFADGIAIDLTSALGKVPGLQVTSHSLAFTYKGRDVRSVGKELHVDAVLEGTVQRSAGRVRVTTQLTRTSDAVALWSDRYERQAQDLFAVQDDITKSIVSELRLTLGAESRATARPTVAGTSSFAAYDSYLRGVYLLEHRGLGVQKSIDFFTDAIAKDSNFARAYGALSEALELLPYFTATPATSVEARAVAAAERALALDSTVAQAHIGLALAREHAYRWDDGAAEYRRALADDSTSAVAHLQYGRHLMQRARILEAMNEFRRATELDPLFGTALVWLAHTYSLAGEHDSALVIGRRAREIDPGLMLGRMIGGIDAIAAGRPDEARSIAADVQGIAPWRGQAAYSLGKAGDTAAAHATIRDLERLPRDTWLIHTALVYASLGVDDTARALSELEAAVRAREIMPKWNPLADYMFDPIRQSPRFAAVVRAFGLDDRVFTSPNGGRPAK